MSNACIAIGVLAHPGSVGVLSSLLLDSDPYDGVDLSEGEIRLAELDRSGTGAE